MEAAISFNKVRIDSFHKKVKQFCASDRAFRTHFQIDKKHIYERAVESLQWIRFGIGNEDMAALIQQGEVNYSRSGFKGNKTEIAIEGKFTNFSWVNPDANYTEVITPEVKIRIILREKKGRLSAIVSVYEDKEIGDENLKEVNRYVW
jgi:hypothetical protein